MRFQNSNNLEQRLHWHKPRASVRQAEAGLAKARANLGQEGEDNAQLRGAIASYRQAEMNLEFTEVRAPVDGYVTNLNLRYGSNVVANQPALALVDVNSYWIDGFFKETSIGKMNTGDKAVVTLMSYSHDTHKGLCTKYWLGYFTTRWKYWLSITAECQSYF